MLHFDPVKRIPLGEVKKHPWLSGDTEPYTSVWLKENGLFQLSPVLATLIAEVSFLLYS
jgi:hypothetical protein